MQDQIPTFDPTQQRQVIPAHMAMVVNAIDEDVSFEICGNPGTPATPFHMKPGDRALVPRTFTRQSAGSGATPREPILFMLTGREAYPPGPGHPAGPRCQTVVPLDEAEATRKRWDAAKAARPRVSTIMLAGADGQPVPLAVPTPHGLAEQAAAAAAPTPKAPKAKD